MGHRYKKTSSALQTVCYDWAAIFSPYLRAPVVIDYETFCKIHDCHDRQGLTIAQTARTLCLHPDTVAKWLARSRYERRRSRSRSSLLDPFKGRITRLLDTHPYSAQQIFQRLHEEGYRGGITILRDYVRRGVSSFVFVLPDKTDLKQIEFIASAVMAELRAGD